MKTVNIIAKDVKLMVEDEKLGKALASISLNPNVTWLKMVITDDKPNANNMRIPKEEFAGVIKTAIYMPLKMANGEISEGHEDTYPLGSIAHLVDKGDHVVALAALWNNERPEDVEFIKNRYDNGQTIDVSWELNYDVHASDKNEDGVIELRNVEMNAVTIVGLPSYMGRTGVTALASKDKIGETEAMDTINREDHDKIVKGLNDTILEQKTSIEGLETKAEELSASMKELESAKAELEELKPEYDDLKKFKDEADAAEERKEKLLGIRKKFEEAGLEAGDDYFVEREETLLKLDDEGLNFFVQELVAFKSDDSEEEDGKAKASVNITTKIPDVKRETKEVSDKDILAHLNELDKPKK